MSRKILGLFFGFTLITILTVVVALTGTCQSQEKLYDVGVTQIVSHPALDSIRKGFMAGMAEQGFIEGKNIRYDFHNPEGDMSVAKTIADKFVADKKDLIATITTPSTQACYAAAEGTGIPIVFVAVTDPVLAGLVGTWEKPCASDVRITGVSDYIPVKPQLELIKEICPKAKVLGAIYNAGDESNTKTVKELKALAPKYGLEVIEANVSTTADTHSAAMSLVHRADVAWSPMCNTTVAGLEGVISVCEEYDIPYFPPDPDSVKRGGVASIYYDNEDLGKLGAEKAARVLRGEDPCRIPVTSFFSGSRKAELTVNPEAAKRMGITIPQSILKKATRIIKE